MWEVVIIFLKKIFWKLPVGLTLPKYRRILLEGAGGIMKINKLDLIKGFHSMAPKFWRRPLSDFSPQDSLKNDGSEQAWESSDSWEQTGIWELVTPVKVLTLSQCLNTKTCYYPPVRAFKPPLCDLGRKKKIVHGYITFPRGARGKECQKKTFWITWRPKHKL